MSTIDKIKGQLSAAQQAQKKIDEEREYLKDTVAEINKLRGKSEISSLRPANDSSLPKDAVAPTVSGLDTMDDVKRVSAQISDVEIETQQRHEFLALELSRTQSEEASFKALPQNAESATAIANLVASAQSKIQLLQQKLEAIESTQYELRHAKEAVAELKECAFARAEAKHNYSTLTKEAKAEVAELAREQQEAIKTAMQASTTHTNFGKDLAFQRSNELTAKVNAAQKYAQALKDLPESIYSAPGSDSDVLAAAQNKVDTAAASQPQTSFFGALFDALASFAKRLLIALSEKNTGPVDPWGV